MPSTLILEGKHDDEVKKCEHAVHFPIKSTTTPATRASSFCSIPPPRSWLLAFRLRPPPPNELQARGSRKEEHWSARARSTGDTESTGKKKAQWASAGLSFLLGHHISCFPFFLPMCPGNIFWGPTRSPMPRNGRVDKRRGALFLSPSSWTGNRFLLVSVSRKRGAGIWADRTFWGASAFVMGRKEKPEGWAWKNEGQYFLSVSPS